MKFVVYFLCLTPFILEDVTVYYKRNFVILIAGMFLSYFFEWD